MIMHTHYYPQGSFIIRGTEDAEESTLWIETLKETFVLQEVVLRGTSPIECLASCRLTSDEHAVNLRGVLRYHSLNGILFAHLTFATPTDLYVWDLHYKGYMIAVPESVNLKLQQAEAHTLDRLLK